MHVPTLRTHAASRLASTQALCYTASLGTSQILDHWKGATPLQDSGTNIWRHLSFKPSVKYHNKRLILVSKEKSNAVSQGERFWGQLWSEKIFNSFIILKKNHLVWMNSIHPSNCFLWNLTLGPNKWAPGVNRMLPFFLGCYCCFVSETLGLQRCYG